MNHVGGIDVENKKERAIDQYLNHKFVIDKIQFKTVDLIYVVLLWAFALLVRIKLFPAMSADYFGFLEIWMNEIKNVGCVKFLAGNTSNYTSPYLYLMCLVSPFDNSLYALKSISVLFDFVAACAVFAIVFELTKSTKKSIFGMSILLLCPTTIIDGAYWCQCDIIYTSLILWAIYFFLKDKSKTCFVFLGIAFSFKLQTLFIIPFFIIMWLKKKNIQLWNIVFIPALYLVMHVPAVLCGRPFVEAMTIYFNQSGTYPWGTLNYPNIYCLLDETIESSHWLNAVPPAGTVFTIIVLGFIAYYLYTTEFNMTNDVMVLIALFTVAITVYFLPHMHDRYGFLIDLIAIIYAVLRPRRLPLLCIIFFVTTLTFMPYLIAVKVMEPRTLAYIQTGVVIYIGYDLYKFINENKIETEG